MVNAPTSSETGHRIYKCGTCEATVCMICHPPKFQVSAKRRPNCYCKKACLCDADSQRYWRVYACSPECHKKLVKYHKHPWRYEKQNFKLTLTRYRNNSEIFPSQHSYNLESRYDDSPNYENNFTYFGPTVKQSDRDYDIEKLKSCYLDSEKHHGLSNPVVCAINTYPDRVEYLHTLEEDNEVYFVRNLETKEFVKISRIDLIICYIIKCRVGPAWNIFGDINGSEICRHINQLKDLS